MRNLGIVVLAGCVSTTRGTTEKISVVTSPSGAEASVAGRTILGFLNENRIFWTTVRGPRSKPAASRRPRCLVRRRRIGQKFFVIEVGKRSRLVSLFTVIENEVGA